MSKEGLRFGIGHNDSDMKIPEAVYISPELKKMMDKRLEEDNNYISLRHARIHRKFNKIGGSNLKRLGDYIWYNIYQKIELDKKEICNSLKIRMSSVTCLIGELNFYKLFPLTIVPVTGKKGFIRAITTDKGDYIKWKKRKLRTMSSMEEVYDKGVAIGEKSFGLEEDLTIKNEQTNRTSKKNKEEN